MEWNSTALRGADELWIIFSFASDSAGIQIGPLVDNIVLEVRYGSSVYLPLFRLDPTPTPTPTPTPLPVYVDNFDDPSSGWYEGTAYRWNLRAYDDGEKWVWEHVAAMHYVPGENYQIYILPTVNGAGGNTYTWFTHPVEFAPLPEAMYPLPQNYCVEARAIFYGSENRNEPWWSHWGLVFGANAAKTEVFTFQINANSAYAVLHYHNYIYPGDRQPFDGTEENVEIKIIDWGPQNHDVWPSTQYNTLKAVVRGAQIDIYINGIHFDTTFAHNMPRDRVGLIGAVWETTPTDVRYDYFRYDPSCPEVQ